MTTKGATLITKDRDTALTKKLHERKGKVAVGSLVRLSLLAQDPV